MTHCLISVGIDYLITQKRHSLESFAIYQNTLWEKLMRLIILPKILLSFKSHKKNHVNSI